jgi:hypothetical protein
MMRLLYCGQLEGRILVEAENKCIHFACVIDVLDVKYRVVVILVFAVINPDDTPSQFLDTISPYQQQSYFSR